MLRPFSTCCLTRRSVRKARGFVWCNETSNTVMAAVANEDRGTIVTRGWYRVEPGKCTRPEVLTRARRIYSYAEAIDGNGQVVKRSGKPLTWGGRTMLCTREASFEISDHKECTGARPEHRRLRQRRACRAGRDDATLQGTMKNPAPRGFGQVETWVFDLDNTLYPHHLNLWQQVDERIRLYIERLLKLPQDDAFRLQKDYYRRYGTTCAG